MSYKKYLLPVAILIATNFVTWIATVYFFQIKTVNILTVGRSTTPDSLFTLTSTPCQPNMKNASCSIAAKASYDLILNEENLYWQSQIDDLRQKGLALASACKQAINRIPTYTSPSIQTTNCHTQAFTGDLVCNTYGN